MFKLLGLICKTALFVGVVLILGSLIRWDGKTVSDQVKTGLSQAERAPIVKNAARATHSLIEDARDAISSRQDESRRPRPKKPGTNPSAQRKDETDTSASHAERIPQEERSLLQAVIRSDGSN